nr:DUF5688 family protein [uncultured Lachnoclostridium sp.]
MEYHQFCAELNEEIRIMLGNEYEVEVKQITKNNGVVKQGLIIGTKESNIKPTIYLENYYEEYCHGLCLKEIAQAILMLYTKEASAENVKQTMFNREDMMDKIVFRVINYDRNQEQLKECPYERCMGDLVMVFYYIIDTKDSSIGSFCITYNHLKHFGLSFEELKQLAFVNTRRMFPSMLRNMEDILVEAFMECEGDDISTELKQLALNNNEYMYVLTNKQKIFGAGCVLYPDVLQSFSDRVNADVVILPSSIHEQILIPYKDTMDIEDLRAMVKEINLTQVLEEERLSDNVYLYDRESDEIKLA